MVRELYKQVLSNSTLPDLPLRGGWESLSLELQNTLTTWDMTKLFWMGAPNHSDPCLDHWPYVSCNEGVQISGIALHLDYTYVCRWCGRCSHAAGLGVQQTTAWYRAFVDLLA